MKISELASTGSSTFCKGMAKDNRQNEKLKRRQHARSQIEDREFQKELEKALGFKLKELIND